MNPAEDNSTFIRHYIKSYNNATDQSTSIFTRIYLEISNLIVKKERTDRNSTNLNENSTRREAIVNTTDKPKLATTKEWTKPHLTTKRPDEQTASINSIQDTTHGYIYENGIGRTGNLLFQLASTLGIAVNLSRNPIFSESFQLLFSMFPNVPHLHFLPLSKYNLYKSSHSYKKLNEINYGIYSKEAFLLRNHTEQNIEVGTYLQSYHYFEHINHDVRHLFSLRQDLNDKAQEMLHNIVQSQATLPLKPRKYYYAMV